MFVSAFILVLAGCSEPAHAPSAAQPTAPQQPAQTSPKLVVSPMVINVEFTEAQTKTVTQTINIRNDGGGVMQWAATKTQQWVWFSDVASGALEAGYSKNVEVNIAAPGLAAGAYTDTINVEGMGASGSPAGVKVNITVKPAPVASEGPSTPGVQKKAVPAPPWEYNEWTNDTYKLRFRYPKTYQTKIMAGMPFGAVNKSGSQNSDMIMIMIESAYGVPVQDAMVEFAKESMRQMGASRLNPKIISSDNQTTLADGVTPAFEMIVDSKSSSTASYESYVFGFKKGNRYIFMAGVGLLSEAPEKMPLWKQMGQTLEITSGTAAED